MSKPNDHTGVIAADELYTLREAGRRLNWGRKTLQRAQRDGLQAVTYGREKYIRGAAILAFFERLENGGRADV